MVAFDRGDRAVGFQQPFEVGKRGERIAQVFENETHEDMVEALRLERQVENVGLQEVDIAQPRALDAGLCGFQRQRRNVRRSNPRPRALGRDGYRLRPDAASGLEHVGACGKGGVVVEQLSQGGGLVEQALIFRS